MESYLAAMNKYADFSGRARRQEYWMFTLVLTVIYAIPYVLAFATKGPLRIMCAVMLCLIALFHLVPGLAVYVRRLHDTGRSGWWILISFVPLIGPFLILYFHCLDGESGTNEYGPNPKASAYARY